jgi:LCP family protein required for cell wall assembly
MPVRWKKILGIVVASQLVVAMLTGATVYAAWHHLNGNIKSGGEIRHQVHKPKDAGPKGPLNILVMGLDTRDCAGCDIDDEAGGDGSDTTILVHISADRKTVYGISIPRDALVKPVDCTKDHLYVNPQHVATSLVEWNEAYAAGGPECTAEQLEKNFGVYVDDYVTVNFGGFQDMVKAVGGVDVCIPVELDDPTYEHYDFKPGTDVHLDGPTALKYVRLRHVLDGSDTGRIKRQQYFISQLIDKVKSAGTLANPEKLYAFANAFTKSIQTNPELASAKALIQLAEQVKDVDLSHIKFITIPSANYPNDSTYYYRVQILPAATTLMQQVAKDQPLGSYGKGAQTAGGTKPSKTPTHTTTDPNLAVGLCG